MKNSRPPRTSRNRRERESERRAFVRSMFALGLVFFVAALSGCGFLGASGDKRLTLGYIGWTENIANSALIEVLAEEDLGYEVELELTDLQPVFQGVSDGEYDAFLDVWMPAHQSVIDEVEGDVELSEEPWYLDETEYGIAVPDYMEAESIADLNDSGVRMITGIEPGALLMERINSRVIPEYGLDLVLVESSTPAMLSELDRAYERKEPIVFLGWAPHWMNLRYEFHYLDDPKDTMSGITDPARLHSAYRAGLDEDDPTAYALLEAMKLTEEQVAEIELESVESGDPKEGVNLWLEDNRDVVEPWLEAARAAEGG
ncbi:MAG: glycine betaine ABC transporter substrate-binding protein [Rubrobacteraceae bacterium]